RVFRETQALSQRGFLYRPDLSIDGLPHLNVSGAFRDSAHVWLDRAVGGNAARSRAENRAAAPNLSGARHAQLRADRSKVVVRIAGQKTRLPLQARPSLSISNTRGSIALDNGRLRSIVDREGAMSRTETTAAKFTVRRRSQRVLMQIPVRVQGTD